MRVTVLGAAGRTGRLLVARLADGHDVRAVVRRESQLDGVAALGGTGVLGDVEADDVSELLSGADAVVWAVGASFGDTAGHAERIRDGGIRAVAAAEASGVGRWVQISSMYADRPDDAPPPMRASMAHKGAVDAALVRSGLAWTVVRPGGLVDDPARGLVTVGSELAQGMITRADVTDVVAELLATGRGEGAAFDLVQGTTPIDEAVAAL